VAPHYFVLAVVFDPLLIGFLSSRCGYILQVIIISIRGGSEHSPITHSVANPLRTSYSVTTKGATEVATREKKGEKMRRGVERQSIDLIVQPKSEVLLNSGSDSA